MPSSQKLKFHEFPAVSFPDVLSVPFFSFLFFSLQHHLREQCSMDNDRIDCVAYIDIVKPSTQREIQDIFFPCGPM